MKKRVLKVFSRKGKTALVHALQVGWLWPGTALGYSIYPPLSARSGELAFLRCAEGHGLCEGGEKPTIP